MSEFARLAEEKRMREARNAEIRRLTDWESASPSGRRRRLKRAYGLHGKRHIKYRRLNLLVKNMIERKKGE